MQKKLRVLIVDDNAERRAALARYVGPSATIVECDTAGGAMGLLRRDRGAVYGGIMLDYDLGDRKGAGGGPFLSGEDVADALCDYMDRTVLIFVHSNSKTHTPALASRLRQAGFTVERVAFDDITEKIIREWVDEVTEAADGF